MRKDFYTNFITGLKHYIKNFKFVLTSYCIFDFNKKGPGDA